MGFGEFKTTIPLGHNPSTQEAVHTDLCAFEASIVCVVSSRVVQLHSAKVSAHKR